MSDHIMGYILDGEYRVTFDDDGWDFDTWMVYSVRRGTDNPVRRQIKGVAAAFTEARKLNRGNLARYEVGRDYGAEDPYSNDVKYAIFDMWWARDPFGRRMETYRSKAAADKFCREMNMSQEWMDRDPNAEDNS